MTDTTGDFITDENLRDVYRAAKIVLKLGKKTIASKDKLRLAKPDDIDSLKIVLADFPPRRLASFEKAFLDVCQDYRQAFKRHMLFGDALPLAAFEAAIDAFADSYRASTIDRLGKLVYFWNKYNAAGEKIGIFTQYFAGGRPGITSCETNGHSVIRECTSVEEIAATYPEFEGYTAVEGAPPEPYLYILMRTDIGSMNPGKGMAQGSHAANQMMYEGRHLVRDKLCENMSVDFVRDAKWYILSDMFDNWEKAANGFGTCIVLGATDRQMRASIRSAKSAGLHAGITNDPTYPVKDGDTFYTLSMDTCAYIFDYQAVVKPHVLDLELHP